MLRSLVLTIACASLLGLAFEATVPTTSTVHRYEVDPPLAHTGGFGEPTCHACHFDASLNASGGSLAIAGVPETYTPGERYRITVQLHREDLSAGGFELAARFADGAQAGTLRADGEVATVSTADTPAVQYAYHAPTGTEPTAPDSIRWTLEWSAPTAREGSAPDTVVFHAAGNAANGDASEFGDFIYTTQHRSNAAGHIE